MDATKTKNLNLLIISGTWPPMRCGVGDYTSMLCEHLAHLPVNIHVITSQHARPDLRFTGSNLLEVHPLLNRWTTASFPVIGRSVAELKPDIINIQWPTTAYGRTLGINLLPAYLRLRFPQTPLVTTLHELRYFRPLSRLRALLYLLLSSQLIVVDPLDVALIKRLYPPALARVRHIPIGSNLPATSKKFDRQARRARLGFASDDFVLGFFGFANPPKGLETLLAAVRELKDTQPDIKLLLLTQLSEEVPYQRRLLHDLHLTGLDAVAVRPEYAEPRAAAEILASADCAVLPFVDGVSVKRGSLMACLAQGLPVITTLPARGEAGEFQNAVNMLLVPPKDPLSLANAILRLKQNPDLRAHLALGAWDLARHFSWEKIAQQHIEVFSRLGKRKPA